MKMPKKMVIEAMKHWQKQLMTESKKDTEAKRKPKDTPEKKRSAVTESTTAVPNTVGAFIELLKRRCNMDDIIVPRGTDKQPMMLIDVYSAHGEAVLDFVDEGY